MYGFGGGGQAGSQGGGPGHQGGHKEGRNVPKQSVSSLKCFKIKCFGPKLFDAKCLLSFASLFGI